jgi:hypothetical protein
LWEKNTAGWLLIWLNERGVIQYYTVFIHERNTCEESQKVVAIMVPSKRNIIYCFASMCSVWRANLIFSTIIFVNSRNCLALYTVSFSPILSLFMKETHVRKVEK